MQTKCNQIKRFKQQGQGMTEYIVIVALIAVAAIAVYQFFGQTIRNQMAGIAKEVAGTSGAAQIQAAGTAATGAATEGTTKKGLDNYTNDTAR
jgi:Flp pilus assembly pilin Flp